MALAAGLGAVFRFGVIAALLLVVLLAISGGGYYYAVFAPTAHDAGWAAECKRLADKVSADRSNCLVTLHLPQAYCDSAYKDRDAAPNCRLPDANATVIDAALARATHRCERDREAAQ
jgi:hypothetical protein